MKRRIVVGHHFWRATVIAVFAAIIFGALAGTAEAKPNSNCTSAITYLNRVSRNIGFARAAGDTNQVMFWQLEYDNAKAWAGGACGW